MIYLSGGLPAALWEAPRADLGVMLNPGAGNRRALRAGLAWAADNGCYALGDRFDADVWLAHLAELVAYRESCLFAVAPDVVGDAAATLARSTPYLPMIRALGFRAAYVLQDGSSTSSIPWDDCDAIFVGGTTEWKLSETAYALAREGKRRGKWVHMGRVNSLIRMKAASAAEIDSVDGTQLAYRPDQWLARLCRWLDQVNGQGTLAGELRKVRVASNPGHRIATA